MSPIFSWKTDDKTIEQGYGQRYLYKIHIPNKQGA